MQAAVEWTLQVLEAMSCQQNGVDVWLHDSSSVQRLYVLSSLLARRYSYLVFTFQTFIDTVDPGSQLAEYEWLHSRSLAVSGEGQGVWKWKHLV